MREGGREMEEEARERREKELVCEGVREAVRK